MTNPIEQEFYKTFDIEPDKSETAYFTGKYNEYPPITDRILLELICVYNKYCDCIDECIIPDDINVLEKAVLTSLVEYFEFQEETDELYHAVRKIIGVEE